MVDKRSIAKGLVLSLFLACAFNFYFAPDSFAGGWVGKGTFTTGPGGTGGGGSAGGSGCSDYYRASNDLDCTGYSWIHYSPTEEAKKMGENATEVFVTPGAGYEKASIPGQCVGENGFWHLGINARGISHSSYWNGVAYFGDIDNARGNGERSWWSEYETGVGNWGHRETLNVGRAQEYDRKWGRNNYQAGGRENLKHILYAGGTAMYEADKIAPNMDAVFDYYKAAAEAAGYSVGTGYPSDLYAFCGGPDGPNTYATRSNVSVRDSENTQSDWDSSGVQNGVNNDTAHASGEFYSDETVVVTFSHNVYASEELKDGQWVIDRDYGVENGRTLSLVSGGTEGGKNDLNEKIGPYYTAYNVYDEENNGYIARDVYNITFYGITEKKEYTICETISFHGGDAVSMACADITVKPSPPEKKYLAKSNTSVAEVGNSDNYDFETTGITELSMDKRAEITIQKGKTAKIIFSHNSYSNKFSIAWANLNLQRSDNLIRNGAGYKIKNRSECNSGNKAMFITYGDNSGYFMGDPRGCSDGVWWYTDRDQYEVEFTSDGTYDFCETFGVDGKNITRICSRVIVGSGGGGNSNPSNSEACPINDPSSGFSGANENKGESNTTTAVVNSSVSKWSSWSSNHTLVYAKPTDKVQFTHCLYSGAQAVRSSSSHAEHSKPHSYDGVTISNSNGGRTAITAGVNQMVVKKFKLWNDQTFTYTAGEKKTYVEESNVYNVKPDDVGSSELYQTSYAVVGGAKAEDGTKHTWSWSWKCPPCTTDEKTGKTTCSTCRGSGSHTNEYYSGKITKEKSTEKTAIVKVPYNFVNTAEIELKDKDIYAGETVDGFQKAVVTTSGRQNNETDGYYATKVPNAKVRFVTYIAERDRTGDGGKSIDVSEDGEKSICNSVFSGTYKNNCEVGGGEITDLNEDGHKNGDSVYYDGWNVNVYDVDAGNFFCVALAVWPYTVENDTVVSSSGFEQWYVSKSSCKVIAKKPTFQVLGGSLYSAGNIKTLAPKKNNLKDNSTVDGKSYDYVVSGVNNTAAFNSWVEQGVVAVGSVNELASGAATGKNTTDANHNYAGFNGYNGSFESGSGNYCTYRVPLSFANYPCNGNGSTGSVMGSFGGSAGIANTGNPGAIADYWLNKINSDQTKLTQVSDNEIDISQEGNHVAAGSIADISAGSVLRYTYKKSDLRLKGTSVPNQTTHIVKVDGGNISITGDITYDKTQGIVALNVIPKLIIYAKKTNDSDGNIYIDCSVKTIDAILIADNKINTCADSSGNTPGIDDPSRSNQLIINGAFVAKQVDFNRTYGAATGVNSGVPAEIVNYDVSSILWGRYTAGSSQSNNLTMTYQHELAPRL